MERLIKYLNKKYNARVSISIKYWCGIGGSVNKHYELLIESHGTECFDTTDALVAHIKKPEIKGGIK